MKNRYKVASLIFALFFLVFLPHNNLLNNIEGAVQSKTVLEKGLVESESTVQSSKPVDRAQKQQDLLKKVGQTLSVNEKYSVSIIDINHSESFGLGEGDFFQAASVMKTLVATVALEGVEGGKYKLNQPLGIADFEYQLQQMINQSNNDSWDFFNSLIGFQKEQQVADQLGLDGVKVNQNQMTTRAAAELLLKHYRGEILKTENRDLLFSYMQNTETENRISMGIPSGVKFYHKTGNLDGNLHDAAIVIHPQNPFILVIFTNDDRGTDWDSRFASFQKAASLVYSYFDSI